MSREAGDAGAPYIMEFDRSELAWRSGVRSMQHAHNSRCDRGLPTLRESVAGLCRVPVGLFDDIG